jgi:aminomethyltransferase
MLQQNDATNIGLTITGRRDGDKAIALVAVQGPNARAKVWEVLPTAKAASQDMKPFNVAIVPDTAFGEAMVARTGYTGEDGFEIGVPATQVEALWNALVAAGVKPAGLGARDTLRLEAGMNLYGQDMDENVTPYEAALAWTVMLDEGRDFIGRSALEAQKAAGVPTQMIGLVMDEKGVLRHGQKVLTANGDGEILSGTFSPTLGKAIAFARVPAGEIADDSVRVDIRGREVPVRVVKFPFVREGKPQAGI